MAAAAEASGEGAWWSIFNRPNLRKFDEPTVQGVDFPTLALSRAWWDPELEVLTLSTVAQSQRQVGQPTSFRVSNAGDPLRWRVLCDGRSHQARSAAGDLEVLTTVGKHEFVLSRE